MLSWTDPSPWLTGRVGMRQCLSRHVHWDNFRASEAAPDQVVAWDDFYPYGQQMAERSANAALPEARFKYTGKERDNFLTSDEVVRILSDGLPSVACSAMNPQVQS